jgi:hypothetical protein
MSARGQTEKSGRATGKLALPSITDIVRQARQVRKVPDSDGGALLCAQPSFTHLKGDDRSSRRPTCRYRAAKLIRETANNELSTKS